jgi:peptidoglycan-associated lipoprotein
VQQRQSLAAVCGFREIRRIAAAALAVGMLLTSAPAFAQSGGRWRDADDAPSPREILIGTVMTGRSAPADRSDVADQILADGLDALRRGDVMLGRRRLEAVVDAYPDSPAARTARDELAILYNIRPRSAPGTIVTTPQADWVPTGVAPPPGSDRMTAEREVRARERQSRLDERRLRTLSDDFQGTAGDRVFFAENSSDIGARARAVLTTQARWLARHPDLPVVVEAHADDFSGNRDLEIQLSERRAKAVRDRLVEEGVEPERISLVAFGRDRPVAICQAPECSAQNRRTVTRLGAPASVSHNERSLEVPAFATVPPRATLGSAWGGSPWRGPALDDSASRHWGAPAGSSGAMRD